MDGPQTIGGTGLIDEHGAASRTDCVGLEDRLLVWIKRDRGCALVKIESAAALNDSDPGIGLGD